MTAKLIPLKRLATMRGGFAFPSEAFGFDGVPVVQMGELRRGVLDLSSAKRISEQRLVERFSLKEGDILLGLSGSIGETGSLGNFAQVRSEDLPAQLNQRLGRFVPNEAHVVPRYLFWLIQSRTFIDQVLVDCTGTAQFNISTNDIEALLVPNSNRAEQTAIANFLDAKTAAIDALIAKKELLIEELKKYQEAVIAEAVKPSDGWSAYKVKQLFKALPKSSLPSGAGEDAGPFKFYVSGEETKRGTEAMHNGTALLLADGGKATLHLAEGAFSWSDHVVCLVSTDSATTEFVYNQLSVQRDLLDAQGFRGTGLPMLDKRWLYEDLSVWLPNSREEALRLNAEIRTVREKTRTLTSNAGATVQELKGYRASLISEAVTGKLQLPA